MMIHSHTHEKRWFWRFGDKYDMFYENGAAIKFRVAEVNFSKEYQQRVKADEQIMPHFLVVS